MTVRIGIDFNCGVINVKEFVSKEFAMKEIRRVRHGGKFYG